MHISRHSCNYLICGRQFIYSMCQNSCTARFARPSPNHKAHVVGYNDPFLFFFVCGAKTSNGRLVSLVGSVHWQFRVSQNHENYEKSK